MFDQCKGRPTFFPFLHRLNFQRQRPRLDQAKEAWWRRSRRWASWTAWSSSSATAPSSCPRGCTTWPSIWSSAITSSRKTSREYYSWFCLSTIYIYKYIIFDTRDVSMGSLLLCPVHRVSFVGFIWSIIYVVGHQVSLDWCVIILWYIYLGTTLPRHFLIDCFVTTGIMGKNAHEYTLILSPSIILRRFVSPSKCLSFTLILRDSWLVSLSTKKTTLRRKRKEKNVREMGNKIDEKRVKCATLVSIAAYCTSGIIRFFFFICLPFLRPRVLLVL